MSPPNPRHLGDLCNGGIVGVLPSLRCRLFLFRFFALFICRGFGLCNGFGRHLGDFFVVEEIGECNRAHGALCQIGDRELLCIGIGDDRIGAVDDSDAGQR